MAIIVILLLQGCFTGIESTPKITYDDVRQENASTLTDEQKYLSQISNQPFGKWNNGKEFIVTDNKISVILKPEHLSRSLNGNTIKYVGYNIGSSVTGEKYTNIIFTNNNGDSLYYKTNATPDELISRTTVDIPFTIQESLIKDVKDKLINNQYYIKTSTWLNADSSIVVGLKYSPVTITNVTCGNSIYPIKLFFTNDSNETHWVYMTVGNEFQATRNFENIFYLANPRLSYTHINDDTWKMISQGKVNEGMTKEECRLALGSPSSSSQLPGTAGVIEIWTFNNGYRLYFEDGILKNYTH